MSFLNNLQANIDEINNMKQTENGAIGFKSSGKKLLDMNFQIPQYRKSSEAAIQKDFCDAMSENELLAVLWMFFVRDARGGLGERRLFRILLEYYCLLRPGVATELLPLVAEYGRWDDLVYATVNTPVWDHAATIIKKQLLDDVHNMEASKPASLLAKWLPSERTSSQKTRILARQVAYSIGMPIKNYNRILSALRKYLDVVEVKMSAKQWSKIDYPSVPSYANLRYKNAFLAHDEQRRREYLEALNKGEAKINSSVLFPHDIIHQYTPYAICTQFTVDPTLEELWKALPSYGGLNDCIVVADGSGSMTCKIDPHSNVTALSVANGLAIYCAEHCRGEFKNKYITFSNQPQFVDFSGDQTLAAKLCRARLHNEVANTNIEAVFDIILDTAIQTHAAQSDLPRTILIVSDMEFDSCAATNTLEKTYSSWARPVRPTSALFNVLKTKYEEAGYRMPKLVFWNVNSRTNTIPVKENDLGVTLVSGYSVGILKMVQSGTLDPYRNLVNTLVGDRYQPILDVLHVTL